MHERKDPLYDGYHTCLRTRISSDMSIKTHACSPAPELPLTSSTPDIRTFPMLVAQHVKEAMIYEGGPFIKTGVLASRMVKLSLGGWSVIARSFRGRIGVMFGPVITTEAHLASSGARTHSNNTAEMTAVIEALSFLGPHGPLARDVKSCFFFQKFLNTLLV